jgi:hypothetical protein
VEPVPVVPSSAVIKVDCQGGEVAVGGGYDQKSPNPIFAMYGSYPLFDGTTWSWAVELPVLTTLGN